MTIDELLAIGALLKHYSIAKPGNGLDVLAPENLIHDAVRFPFVANLSAFRRQREAFRQLTATEAFLLLPYPYRDLAIRNLRAQCPDLETRVGFHALTTVVSGTFTWDSTPQGEQFWRQVHNFVAGGDLILPPAGQYGRQTIRDYCLATFGCIPAHLPISLHVQLTAQFGMEELRAVIAGRTFVQIKPHGDSAGIKSVSPKWARYVMQDQGGRVWVSFAKPWLSKKKQSYWAAQGAMERIEYPPYAENWKESLYELSTTS